MPSRVTVFVTPEKKTGPLTRLEERGVTATEKRLTRAEDVQEKRLTRAEDVQEKRLTRAEAVQEYEQSFIFDQEKFTFRELSVFLMTMQAWGAATISCKGTWQKIGASLELASLLCGMDVCHILYEKKWRVTNSSSPYLKLPNLKRRYEAVYRNRHSVYRMFGAQLNIEENKKKVVSYKIFRTHLVAARKVATRLSAHCSNGDELDFRSLHQLLGPPKTLPQLESRVRKITGDYDFVLYLEPDKKRRVAETSQLDSSWKTVRETSGLAEAIATQTVTKMAPGVQTVTKMAPGVHSSAVAKAVTTFPQAVTTGTTVAEVTQEVAHEAEVAEVPQEVAHEAEVAEVAPEAEVAHKAEVAEVPQEVAEVPQEVAPEAAAKDVASNDADEASYDADEASYLHDADEASYWHGADEASYHAEVLTQEVAEVAEVLTQEVSEVPEEASVPEGASDDVGINSISEAEMEPGVQNEDSKSVSQEVATQEEEMDEEGLEVSFETATEGMRSDFESESSDMDYEEDIDIDFHNEGFQNMGESITAAPWKLNKRLATTTLGGVPKVPKAATRPESTETRRSTRLQHSTQPFAKQVTVAHQPPMWPVWKSESPWPVWKSADSARKPLSDKPLEYQRMIGEAQARCRSQYWSFCDLNHHLRKLGLVSDRRAWMDWANNIAIQAGEKDDYQLKLFRQLCIVAMSARTK